MNKNRMIVLENVTKSYGEKAALQGISFDVENGELCVLIGPSGCGKSTTLKLINRMLEPDGGEILIEGRSVRDFKPELLRRKIGYVIQSIGLFPHMKVSQNIAVVPSLLKWERKRIGERVDYLLELVGLDPAIYRDKYPNELSGGEAQRIGVARALASDPPLLLMDEPFGAVDPLNREILQVEFLKIQRKLKKTVILVTHDLDEAIKLADKIVIMDMGRIVQIGQPENILSKPANSFVRNFVGTDRAIKRLSRFQVADYMNRASSTTIRRLKESNYKEAASRRESRFLWITDEMGILTGWIDFKNFKESDRLEEGITHVDPSNFAVRAEFTLKESLSRMLSQGVRSLPVTDEKNRLIGEINLSTIEKLTELEE